MELSTCPHFAVTGTKCMPQINNYFLIHEPRMSTGHLCPMGSGFVSIQETYEKPLLRNHSHYTYCPTNAMDFSWNPDGPYLPWIGNSPPNPSRNTSSTWSRPKAGWKRERQRIGRKLPELAKKTTTETHGGSTGSWGLDPGGLDPGGGSNRGTSAEGRHRESIRWYAPP